MSRETLKEQRERKAKERKRLIEELNHNWEYTNNTVYKNEFRAAQLVNMIDIITWYLHDDQQLFLKNEQYHLLHLIRQLAKIHCAKSPRNKANVRNDLIIYETLAERAEQKRNKKGDK